MLLVAYIFDVRDGTQTKHIVSDDYADAAALKAIHCGPNEDAVVQTFSGTLESNKQGATLPRHSEAQIDALIVATGVAQALSIKYALYKADGTIFDIIETRRVADRRLTENRDVAQFSVLASAIVEMGDTIVAGVVVKKPPSIDINPPLQDVL